MSAASGEAQPYLPLRSLRSLGLRARILSRFPPSAFALRARASRSLHSLGLRARYLPHVTSSVPRSVHAKFHADRSKNVGARGIHTHRHTDRQTDRQSFFYYSITIKSLPTESLVLNTPENNNKTNTSICYAGTLEFQLERVILYSRFYSSVSI